ncbi:MAG: 30S ribosomal protein S19e [archaeon]
MIEEISPSELVEALAKEMPKLVQKPEWADFVKTGVHKERPPTKEDWWYIRTAAVLRTVYVKGPIGVSKLRTKYGGKKNRGVKPERFKRGSGKILRTVLQQLEAAGLIKQGKVGVHKGRMLTAKGKKLMKSAAENLYKTKPKPAPEPTPKPAPAATPAKPAKEPQPKAPEPKKEAKAEVKAEKKTEEKKPEVKEEKKHEVKKEEPKKEPETKPKEEGKVAAAETPAETKDKK